MQRTLFLDPSRAAQPLARLLAAAAAIALAGGLVVQHGLGYPPCSLCVLQRLAFAATLVAVLPLAWGRCRPGVTAVLAGLALVSVLLGLGVAVYQVALNAFPMEVPRCGRGPAAYFDDTPLATVAGWLLDAAGDCGKPPSFFGIVTMPQLGLLVFLMMTPPAVLLALRAWARLTRARGG